MTQQIEFTSDGLNLVSIGAHIGELSSIDLKSLVDHKNKDGIRTWFEDDFDYYFIDSDSMFITDIGLVDEIFVVPNELGQIVGIFVFVANAKNRLQRLLDDVYDTAKLKSDTSIDGEHIRSQMFWKKNELSIFLGPTRNPKYSKISIIKIPLEQKSPGVNIA